MLVQLVDHKVLSQVEVKVLILVAHKDPTLVALKDPTLVAHKDLAQGTHKVDTTDHHNLSLSTSDLLDHLDHHKLDSEAERVDQMLVTTNTLKLGIRAQSMEDQRLLTLSAETERQSVDKMDELLCQNQALNESSKAVLLAVVGSQAVDLEQEEVMKLRSLQFLKPTLSTKDNARSTWKLNDASKKINAFVKSKSVDDDWKNKEESKKKESEWRKTEESWKRNADVFLTRRFLHELNPAAKVDQDKNHRTTVKVKRDSAADQAVEAGKI